MTDPYSWVPTAGAAATELTSPDQTFSDGAADNTRLSGSPENARNASDYLRAASHVGMLVSAAGEEAAAAATTIVTAVIKIEEFTTAAAPSTSAIHARFI